MKIITSKQELYKLEIYPKELVASIEDTITVLDENYGINRDIQKDLGGYVVILESSKDIEDLKTNIIVGVEPEYTDIIACKDSSKYIQSLYLLSNDYSIMVYALKELMKYFQ